MADTVEDLFDVPLDEFVAAREDLAKRLKAEGRTDEAATEHWVAEQVRRRHPDAVEAPSRRVRAQRALGSRIAG